MRTKKLKRNLHSNLEDNPRPPTAKPIGNKDEYVTSLCVAPIHYPNAGAFEANLESPLFAFHICNSNGTRISACTFVPGLLSKWDVVYIGIIAQLRMNEDLASRSQPNDDMNSEEAAKVTPCPSMSPP